MLEVAKQVGMILAGTNTTAVIAVVAIAALGVVGFALYVVLAALKKGADK